MAQDDWQWWVIKTYERDKARYLGVYTDAKPEGQEYVLEFGEGDCMELEIITEYEVVYGPCSSDEATDYLCDMDDDEIECFVCGCIYSTNECAWCAVEQDEDCYNTEEIPICPFCGVGRP